MSEEGNSRLEELTAEKRFLKALKGEEEKPLEAAIDYAAPILLSATIPGYTYGKAMEDVGVSEERRNSGATNLVTFFMEFHKAYLWSFAIYHNVKLLLD